MSIETSSRDKKTSAAVLSDLKQNHKIHQDTILINSNHCGVFTLIASFTKDPVIQVLPGCNSPWKTASLTFQRRPRRSTLLDGFGLLDACYRSFKSYKVHTHNALVLCALSHVQALLSGKVHRARAVVEHNHKHWCPPICAPSTYWSPPASFGGMILKAHLVWRSCPERASMPVWDGLGHC